MKGSKEEQETECARENEKPRRLSFPFFQLFLELFLAEEAEEEEDDGVMETKMRVEYIYIVDLICL